MVPGIPEQCELYLNKYVTMCGMNHGWGPPTLSRQ